MVLKPLMAPVAEAMGSVGTPAWRLKKEIVVKKDLREVSRKSGLRVCGPGRNAMRVVETRAVNWTVWRDGLENRTFR